MQWTTEPAVIGGRPHVRGGDIDIPSLAKTLLDVELLAFTLIAVTTTRRWLRHREAASGWLSATFGSLAGLIALGQLLPQPPYSPLMLLLVKAFLGVLLLFPYFLYRFMATFGKPCRAVGIASHLLVGGVLAMTVLIPRFPSIGEPRTPALMAYSALIAVEWVSLSAVVVFRLWRAGRFLPAVARRRSQMLAGGAAVLALNVVISGATPSHTQTSLTNVVLECISILSAVLFLFGFRPPHALLRRWRRSADDGFKAAMISLVQATSSDEVVVSLLPRIAELVGADGATLTMADGTLLGHCGVPGGASEPAAGNRTRPTQLRRRTLQVPLPQGSLEIWSSPYTPFFGREELDLLHSLGSLLLLTLDRTLAQEHAERAAGQLAEAQQIAQLGSWSWEPGTGAQVWSAEMFRLYEAELGDQDLNRAAQPDRLHPDDVDAATAAVMTTVEGGPDLDAEWRIRNLDGSFRWLHVRGRLGVDALSGQPILRGTCQDITERQALQAQLTEQALHDELTGLPNRRMFAGLLSHALAEAVPASETVAVLFIDIDRFKLINDGLGHEAGDDLLIGLGRRLTDIMRPGDSVARFGGDEFLVLCQHLTGAADAQAITRRIEATMAQPFTLRGVEMVITVSIGISLSTLTGADAGGLVRDADAAMYRAKRNGRARHALFAEDIRSETLRRLDTERELRRALTEEQLEVHYQPIFDLRTGAVDSLEALVRWQHPTRGLLAPGEFIEVAEETGLIVPLGEWVLEQACRQLKHWQQSSPALAQLGMAVNLSGIQVALPDLTDRIERILTQTGVQGTSLELEITESVLMRDAEDTMAVLRSLKRLGVRLSVDDFGTGYSSLSYLKRFPVDTLKVDRTFVDGIGVDSEDSAIVRSIVALASTLGMTTIGEGVENAQQLSTLTTLGCTKAQGFHLARPARAPVIEEFLLRPPTSGQVPPPRSELTPVRAS